MPLCDQWRSCQHRDTLQDWALCRCWRMRRSHHCSRQSRTARISTPTSAAASCGLRCASTLELSCMHAATMHTQPMWLAMPSHPPYSADSSWPGRGQKGRPCFRAIWAGAEMVPMHLRGASKELRCLQVPLPYGLAALRWLQGQPQEAAALQPRVYFSPRRSSAPDTPGGSEAEATSAGTGAVAGGPPQLAGGL